LALAAMIQFFPENSERLLAIDDDGHSDDNIFDHIMSIVSNGNCQIYNTDKFVDTTLCDKVCQ
jgi:S-adenosylmethionine:tRNA-ribosyltransferase-isomerase (queuine synthetase)